MKFPDIITVCISDSETGQPISNIAVMITLFVHHKNDYHFILPISDSGGKIVIAREWLDREIEGTRNLFIMDYSSKLDDCQPKFLLKIMDIESVHRAIKAQKLFQRALDIKQEYIDRLSKVDNYQYTPISEMVDLSGDMIFNVELNLKKNR